MPEKSKKRKNNKNKRKNKYSRVDANSNNNATNNSADSISSENIKKGESDSNLNENKCNIQNNLLPKTSSENDKEIGNDNEAIINIDKTDKIKINEHLVNCDTLTDIAIEEPPNTYIVEAPGQTYKDKSKLSSGKKSKSVDDDESLRIIEITEDNSVPLNHDNIMNMTNSVLISEIDSDVKWETIDLEENPLPKVQEAISGTLSVETIPLTKANCEQAKLLSPEEELSLRHYLKTLNLTTNPSTSLEIKTEIEQIINSEIKHRLRKKGSADDVFSQRLGAPRILDVIDEEVSGESSIHSRRHSYLSDKKSDNDDLEDDVFEQPCNRSNTRKGYNIQEDTNLRKKSLRELIPQKCVLVGAKLKDPEISEARGDWTIQTVEKMSGAEVVYLTDSSSSTSSLYDVCEDMGNEQDTDVTIRIITPTIEVTDTENLLKKSFIPENDVKNIISTDKCNTVTDVLSENFEEPPLNNNNSNNTNSKIEETLHEVVVLTTDNITTDLIVKDIDGNKMTSDGTKSEYDTHVSSETINIKSNPKFANDYDLEMKVLKCELNDAINNLIKEVSDSESVNENSKETFIRRDSSSSISSSQCTAIYNPNSSLIDISMNDDLCQYGNNSKEASTSSHVHDVIESVIKNSCINERNGNNEKKEPQKLRDMCVERISSFPYGEKILEELANVSMRLQNNTFGFDSNEETKYCKTKRKDIVQNTSDKLKTLCYRKPNGKENLKQLNKLDESCDLSVTPTPIPPPPPVPRNSSLKKSKDVSSNFETSTVEKPYVCLSPSQKMLMEKTNTVFNKENVSQTELIKNNSNFLNSEQLDKNSLKSQTGSRLMALICDPTFTSNINSSLNKFCDTQIHPKKKSDLKSFNYSEKYSDSLLKLSPNSIKPAPPPRPTKMLSSFYESDENSDYQENSFKSLNKERKIFHFSTGNLSKEIEDDITNIQNMHRNYMNVRNQTDDINRPRRPSLPKDLCDQQMEYIRKKEKEVEAEIQRLERENLRAPIKKGPRAPMIKETEIRNETVNIPKQKSTKGMLWNTLLASKRRNDQNSSIFSSSQEELLREKMYSEYLNEIAEREQRKHHKVIKITNTSLPSNSKMISKSMSALDILDSKVNNRIEQEFISKARERWNKLGIRDPESEDETNKKLCVYREPKFIEHKIKVIEAGEEKDVHRLPSHLQEFVSFTTKDKHQESGYTGESKSEEKSSHVVILCAVMLLVLAIGRHILRLLRNI